MSTSGYFSFRPTVDKAILDRQMAPILENIPGATRMKTGQTRLVVGGDVLDRLSPVHSSTRLAWILRNAHRSDLFFQRANLVGGPGVLALNSAQFEHVESVEQAWKIVEGKDDALVGDKELDMPICLEIAEVVIFAGKMSPDRLHRLFARLNLTGTDEGQTLQMAATIFHKLPPRHEVRSVSTSVAVRGDTNEIWPEAMRNTLERHGVFTEHRPATNAWFACWEVAKKYHSNASNVIDNDVVQFVRAEADDDDDVTADTGYITYLLKVYQEAESGVVLLTTHESRAAYIGKHAEIETWTRPVSFAPDRISPGSIIIIDRAHQIEGDTLLTIIRTLVVGKLASRVVVGGSLFVPSKAGTASLFATLYHQASPQRRTVCSTTVGDFKVAAGRSLFLAGPSRGSQGPLPSSSAPTRRRTRRPASWTS